MPEVWQIFAEPHEFRKQSSVRAPAPLCGFVSSCEILDISHTKARRMSHGPFDAQKRLAASARYDGELLVLRGGHLLTVPFKRP